LWYEKKKGNIAQKYDMSFIEKVYHAKEVHLMGFDG